jgi:hypothetical protein
LNSVELHASDTRLDELLRDVRRIYRRMGVLRATERHAEALDLEVDEFSRALSLAHDAGATERQTSEVLAEEATRIANATALAEILAPLLAEKLRSAPVSAPLISAPAVPAPQPSAAPSARAHTHIKAAPSPRPAPAGSPTVADLLEGVFAPPAETPRARP